MNNINISITAISLIFLASCQSRHVEPKKFNIADRYVENNDLCQVAKQKKYYLGKELVIMGTYETDFLHGSSINARCVDGGSDGLVIGFISKTEKNNLIKKQWREMYCGTRLSCLQIYIPVTLRGELSEHEDGIYFDVNEIIINEKP